MRPPTVNNTKISGDFPAAHSMDTEWFAADQLGQVAVFRTQEDGPMPVNVFGPVTADYGSWFLATLCRSRCRRKSLRVSLCRLCFKPGDGH